jgi:ATP-dependent exoDNAse (exonuclease V) beta subunit
VKLPDESQRRAALTDLDSSLLVEAAAGTGKTSLMAGRVAMLLAGGAHPSSIAAITFTELAASELGLRIRGYVHELLQGRIPSVFASALPKGLTPDQTLNLAQAAKRLDEVTASTIHGFCQDVITSYAVEAGLDPGARVVDAADADVIFDAAFQTWLINRLSQADDASDPILVLSKSDPLKFVDMLKDLASLKRRHPTARVLPLRPGARADIEFTDAVDEFARWAARTKREARTEAIVADLCRLADFFRDCFDSPPGFSRLWLLAQPPRVDAMKKRLNDLAPYRRKSAWKEIYGPQEGEKINAEAEAHFERAESAYHSLLGQIANGLVGPLSAALDDVVTDYNARKRAAAALDFDDLLLRAHELVHRNETVRQALGGRYRHIFVDEFQDTDPIQAAFIFQIAADRRADRWQDVRVRPGALFLVGDPKQAIYRFRGADIRAYVEARKAMEAQPGGKVIQVTANFRSRKGVLDHVNDCFDPVLSSASQPGYVKLTHTIEDPDGALPAVAKVTINLPPDPDSETQREAEAEAVADICARLIGSLDVVRADGSRSRLNPGDIALLTPTGTELWRYERALEQQGLSVASQAGQTLFLRQATQDVVALMRVLADPLDTLAFGAFMRGPLVGLTDAELLDITEQLQSSANAEGRPKYFSVLTEAELVAHPLARQVLEAIQLLRRRAATTTPMLLLSEAAEQLQMRVVLAARYGNRSARALANLDSLIEMARPYGVAGLRNFVHDLQRHWEAKTAKPEGRTDASDGAIEIVTMHSSKGLEWPVVIPINSSTILRSPPEFVHRQSDNTLHWVLGGVTPTDLLEARQEEEHNQARERERVWYVACTRARDMLILPHLSEASTRSWSRAVDLGHGRLPEIRMEGLPKSKSPTPAAPANWQTPETFAAQAALVARASPAIKWKRPSDEDYDRAENFEIAPAESTGPLEAPIPLGGGRLRGILLHKLMEEFLTGELAVDEGAVRGRARVLLEQLVGVQGLDSGTAPDPEEAADTALRTLHLPDVAALRSGMMAEIPIWASQDADTLLAGRADATVVDKDGTITAVFDWKSDVAPSPADRSQHAGQLSDYLSATGAPRGAVVYMTLGETIWVRPAT